MAIFLAIYFFFRPGLYEKEYTERLASKTHEVVKKIERFEGTREFSRKDYQKFFDTAQKIHGPFEYFAVFDASNAKLFTFTLDRESELFYSITQDIASGQIKAEEKPLVRFYNQKKFFIFVKPVPGGTLALSYRFEPTRKDLIRLSLEITLLVLMSIFFAAALHLYRYRSGKIPAEVHRVVKVGGPSKTVIPDLEERKNEISASASERLKSYVFELFSNISSSYAPDAVSVYLMNRESTRMSKSFEMKGKSFITIDSPDLDVIQVQNDIGKELQRSSVLVLSNGMRLLIPIMYRNTLLGAVNISRGVPFQGLEIKEIRSLFDKLAQFLSEYILYHDVVVDARTGLYTNFYFLLKYEELLGQVPRGGRFAVLEIALVRGNLPQGVSTGDITRAISKKLFDKIGKSGIASLYDTALRIILPGADKDSAMETAQALISSLSGLAVKTDSGKIVLTPVIGLASTAMPGCAENPLEAARANLHYTLSTGESNLEFSRIKNI